MMIIIVVRTVHEDFQAFNDVIQVFHIFRGSLQVGMEGA